MDAEYAPIEQSQQPIIGADWPGFHALRFVRQALEDALRFGLVQRNVADLVKAPQMAKHPMHVFTPEQARLFLETAKGSRLEAFYVLALNTGMRLGELLGLKWRDLDLDAGTVQLQTALKKAESGHALGKPKTAGSRRKIMLTPSAVAALRAHRTRQLAERLKSPAWNDNDLVFTNAIGDTLCPTAVYRRNFKSLVGKAGLPMIRLHDLRHTAATLLLLSGVHPKVVSEMLGHSSITITLNLYSHVLPDMQASATSAMERLLGAQV